MKQVSHNSRPSRMQGIATTTLLGSIGGGLVAIALVAFLVWYFTCPCERLPGARLSGQVIEEPVNDWALANQTPLCQLEVDMPILSQAHNLNCWSGDNGQAAYLSCSQCAGKRWSNRLVDIGEARLRLGDQVFPVQAQRVTDPAQLDAAWQARAEKTGDEVGERPDHWWSFRLTSR